MKRRRGQIPKPTASLSAPAELPTFLQHVHELRRRLFWIVGVILVTSAAAYPFLGSILHALTAPLGGQQLYYLTPIGGLSFSIKICLYVGVLLAVPVFMYHLYRFLEPLMGARLRRSTFFYVGMSTLLAVTGALFAYFISLPGALHFLTGMNLTNVQAMLTVDSYLGFVMVYLLGAALLFQIPLLLLIINTFTPLKPSKLMKLQRYVIVGAFIIAAIISPTPDILNQLMFAVPIIAMYEIGVGAVWLQNRRRPRAAAVETAPVVQPRPVPAPMLPQASATPAPTKVAPAALARRTVPTVRSLDGFGAARPTGHPSLRKVAQHAAANRPPALRPARLRTTQSVDGFTAYRRPQTLTPS